MKKSLSSKTALKNNSTPHQPKAIIIIPTYNEKENISRLIPAIWHKTASIKNWQIEILVVDDSSPDGTADAVRTLQNKSPQGKNIHLLINKKKAGLGAAYLSGMKEAFDRLGADVIFEFDADFSHDPAKLPEFFERLDAGDDFVIGGRYRHGGSIDPDWPLLRKFYSIVGNLVIMFVLGDFRIGDWTSGYRAIRREVFEAIRSEMDDQRFSGYTWQIGLLHKTVRRGFRVSEVPIYFKDRQVGESKLGSEYIKNTLLYIFQVRAKEILCSKFLKVAIVGGIGFIVQMLALAFFRSFVSNNYYQLAVILATEVAIISNFIINNLWTFHDQKISSRQIPLSFLKFNLGSCGSILIQLVFSTLGKYIWGLVPLFTLGSFIFDTGYIYVIVGILVGLVFNFWIYNKFIWKADGCPKK